MATGEKDYYATLGIDRKASLDTMSEAFAASRARLLAQGGDPSLDPEFMQVQEAYEALSDPIRRATYDSLLLETVGNMLNVHISASNPNVAVSDEEQIVYALIDVMPPEQETKQQLPLNLCLVIDRSTSMQGNRLDCVKSAVDLIIDQLAPNDILSVISFSDRAEIVIPAAKVSNKNALLGKVNSIRASGGTEIFQGLVAGLKQMKRHPLRAHTNHLILLTDGHTYGDSENCLSLAEKTARSGIGMSAFGIGAEWNDQFLDNLVAPSGGQSNYIEQPKSIIEHLQSKIQGLGSIYAKNVRMRLNMPTAVSLNYAFKLIPFAQPVQQEDNLFFLGDIEGRTPLSVLLELKFSPLPFETRLRLPISFVADIPAQNMREHLFQKDFSFTVQQEAQPYHPPEEVLKAVRALNIHRMNEKVWDDVEGGDLNNATVRMRHLTTRLLEAGETQLAMQAQMEAERLVSLGTLSLEGRKRLKYGTRALMNKRLIINIDNYELS